VGAALAAGARAIARRAARARTQAMGMRTGEGALLPSARREAPRMARAPWKMRPRRLPLPELDPADDAFAWRFTVFLSVEGALLP